MAFPYMCNNSCKSMSSSNSTEASRVYRGYSFICRAPSFKCRLNATGKSGLLAKFKDIRARSTMPKRLRTLSQHYVAKQ